MNRELASATLEEHLQAQLALLQACSRRAAAARDPRLRSAWIGPVAQLGHAMAEAGSLIAALGSARPSASFPDSHLRLPILPPVAGGGDPTPSMNPQNNSRRFLQEDQQLGAPILLRLRGRRRAGKAL